MGLFGLGEPEAAEIAGHKLRCEICRPGRKV